MIVNEHLDTATKRAKEKVDWLLELEKAPTTLNVHYYSYYKGKFLAYYKGCRDEGELTRKLQTYKAPVHANGTASFQQSIYKALGGLNEAGIVVQPSDLPKLLPDDPMEPALKIMAGVRAYFQGRLLHRRRDTLYLTPKLMQLHTSASLIWFHWPLTTRWFVAWRGEWNTRCAMG
jgi:hypothetical protein